MRTLVLAEYLEKIGLKVTYACRAHPGNMINFIEQKGYPVRRLPKPEISFDAHNYASWLGDREHTDRDASFDDQSYHLTIVDHYGASANWEKLARRQTRLIMRIDDEGIENFDCDILLNQNPFMNPEKLYTKTNGVKLIGPKFALLRPEFWKAQEKAKIRDKMDNLLIMLGGTDPENINHKIVKALNIDCKVTVVVGFNFPKPQALKTACKEKGYRFIRGTTNVAELMLQADFCIGAGGTTSYERCCLGLPSATLVLAQNQINITETLEKMGAVISLGDLENFDVNQINMLIERIQKNTEIIKNHSIASFKVMSG